MKREILKGQKFMATLSVEDVQWIAEQFATNFANKKIKKALLDGKMMTREEQKALKAIAKTIFAKKVNKQLIEIVKDEFKDM